MITEMDDKDFRLDDINEAASKINDLKKSIDSFDDISFNRSPKNNDPDETDTPAKSISEDADEENGAQQDKAEESIDTGAFDTESADEETVNDSANYEDEFEGFGDDVETDQEMPEGSSEYSETAPEEENTVEDQSFDDSEADEEYPDDEYEDGYDDEPGPDREEPDEEEEPEPKKRKSVKRSSKPAKRSSGSSKNKKKRRGSRINNSIFGALILVTIILTVSLVVAITGIKIGMEYLGVGKSENDITFNIPENATPEDICDILIANNIIENKTLFKIAMKLQHSPTLFPGDITLHPSMGYSAVIEELSKQRDIRKTVKITFPEGITLLEAATMLEEKNVCTAQEFIFEFDKKQGFSYESMIDNETDAYYKMEGFFFPDTYEFYEEDDGYNVARTIKANFANKFTDEMQSAMKAKNMSLSDLITLASIVQWEANSAEDMPKVASVFLNRLADPDTFPKLQSDATGNYLKKVINVVGDTASKEHYAELYDTYQCIGLPPGPVCNPGVDAINSVLNPDKTKYYYFCNNLKTGKSYFAETLEEHEKNLVKAGLAK